MKTIKLNDGREIKYELTRKRVKNVNMRLKPDGIVYVSANTRVSVKRIEELLIERADYFLNATERLQEREKRNEVSADHMRWLGKDYPVRVIYSARECVVLEENELRVFTKHHENAERMLRNWAGDKFVEVLTKLNEEVRSTLEKAGLKPPPTAITIREMKTRWGSLRYNRGSMSINFHLIAYPRETILGVLWHEYAHYWHHDHSARFYEFVLRFYPDYYKWDAFLK